MEGERERCEGKKGKRERDRREVERESGRREKEEEIELVVYFTLSVLTCIPDTYLPLPLSGQAWHQVERHGYCCHWTSSLALDKDLRRSSCSSARALLPNREHNCSLGIYFKFQVVSFYATVTVWGSLFQLVCEMCWNVFIFFPSLQLWLCLGALCVINQEHATTLSAGQLVSQSDGKTKEKVSSSVSTFSTRRCFHSC